jgi:uncharacterized protein
MTRFPPRSWYEPRLALGPSPIHGTGMFASQPIAAGERVAVVGGELLADADFRERTATLDRYNAIQVDEDQHLLGPLDELETAKINHSCDSSLWMRDENTIEARRSIAAGEEATIDYALFTTQEDWRLDGLCRCGATACRRSVTGRDWRREDAQARYRGHFSPFLNRQIDGALAR